MIRGLLANATVRGFVHILGGNATVALAQGLQFLLLARALGPTEFGLLSAASSVATILIPFSGMGAANVLVMRGSRDPTLIPVYLGNAFLVMLVTGTLLVLLSTVGTSLLMSHRIPTDLLIVFAVSEMIAAKFVDVSWHVFVATQKMHMVSRFLITQSAARLVTAIAYISISAQPSATGWVWWALASNALVAISVVWTTTTQIGRLSTDIRLLFREFGNGVYFAVGLSAKSFYTDADKVLLGRFGDVASLGQYTAAYRLIQIAMMPTRALSSVLQSRLFRAGASGVDRSLEIVLRVLGPVSLFSLVVAGLYYLCAPLVPWLTGDSYLPSVKMLQFVCLLPLVQAVQSLLNDALSSAGHQRLAAIIQMASAVLVFGLGMSLIPRFGWRGAALSSYLAQLMLCGLISVAIVYARRPRVALEGELRE